MVEQGVKPVIRLESERQLRIYSLPLRQRILRTMRIMGKPVTAKQVADRLGISPSSARHHLLKLKEIGLVEHDRYELINGIKADFLRVADVNISIGTNMDDHLAHEREATTRMMLAGTGERFMSSLSDMRAKTVAEPDYFPGDLLGGIVHLDQKEAKELYTLIRDFLDTHGQSQHDQKTPWEYAFLLYETEA